MVVPHLFSKFHIGSISSLISQQEPPPQTREQHVVFFFCGTLIQVRVFINSWWLQAFIKIHVQEKPKTTGDLDNIDKEQNIDIVQHVLQEHHLYAVFFVKAPCFSFYISPKFRSD